jgi:hypothetical protein
MNKKKTKFQGSYADLRECVARTGFVGKWRDLRYYKQFRNDEDDAVLNFYESTGTVNFQGPALAAKAFEAALLRATDSDGAISVMREIRQRIRELKRELEEQVRTLSEYFKFLNGCREALDIARKSAERLLRSDPFEAGEEIEKQRNKEFDEFVERSPAERKFAKKNHSAKANIEKLMTPQIRQIIWGEELLRDYVTCFDQLFSDFRKLKSFDAAIELTEGLHWLEPLKALGRPQKREDDLL